MTSGCPSNFLATLRICGNASRRAHTRWPKIQQHNFALQFVHGNLLAVHGGDRKNRAILARASSGGLCSAGAHVFGISGGGNLYELFEPGFGSIVLLQTREQFSIDEHRVRKIGVCGDRLADFLMRAS